MLKKIIFKKIDIPKLLLQNWQEIVNIMAHIIGVPAGLIMRIVDDDIEVFVSSKTENNPYSVGGKEHLIASGLYCETVIKTKKKLLVPNALLDNEWKDNPDTKINMISYLGFPLLYPDKTPFGTICVLDNKKNSYSKIYEGLILKFSEVIQTHLNLEVKSYKLEMQNKKLRVFQQKLEKSENRFRELFNNMGSGVAIYEPVDDGNDFVFKDINDSGCRLTNINKKQILDKRVTEVFPEVKAFELFPVLQEVYKTGKPKKHPVRFYQDKKLSRWFKNYVYRLSNDQIVAIYEDVTSNKKFEFDLLESKKNMEKISRKLHKNLIGTVTALANTVEYRDRYTIGHSRNVSDLACAIAQHMGLQSENIEALKMAGFLHDIGKIAIPLETLVKPNPLTKEEFNVIKTHPLIGYQLVQPVEFPLPVAQMILEHHERLNGTGYPCGKTDNELLFESKILAVADVVEAMSLDRPYRKALGIKKALKEITKHKGVLFDSEIVYTCVRLFKKKGFKFKPPPKEPEFTLGTIEGYFE